MGSEHEAHHVGAELFQSPSDVGFTTFAGGMTYWIGEAMRAIGCTDPDFAEGHPIAVTGPEIWPRRGIGT